MHKKVCFITGATSGIGKEVAISLAKKGFVIVFTAINKKEGGTALRDIISDSKNKGVEFIVCDLSSFEQVKKCAETFKKNYKRIDVLINNAGVWMPKRKMTVDGFEYTFQVNYLSQFLLTNLLLNNLEKESRVINISSNMLIFGKINFENLNMTSGYNSYRAYSNSKLAVLLFTKELARRLSKKGVFVNAVHPGFVASNITNKKHSLGDFIFKTFGTSPKKAAETIVYLATTKELNVSGEYFFNKKIKKHSKRSNDSVVMKKLWNISYNDVKEFL